MSRIARLLFRSFSKGPLTTSDFKTIISESISSLPKKSEGQAKKHLVTPAYIDPDYSTVFLSGVPREWKAEHAIKYFSETFPSLESVIPIRSDISGSSPNMLLKFPSQQQAEAFIERYDNDFIHTVDVVNQLKAKLYALNTRGERIRVDNSKAQVEVYNLPFEATQLDILRICGEAKVKDIQMPMKTSRKNKGFAIVTFHSGKVAREFEEGAKELTLYGRKLGVKRKFFQFDSQKERLVNKSDFVLESVERSTAPVRGTVFQAMLEGWKKSQHHAEKH